MLLLPSEQDEVQVPPALCIILCMLLCNLRTISFLSYLCFLPSILILLHLISVIEHRPSYVHNGNRPKPWDWRVRWSQPGTGCRGPSLIVNIILATIRIGVLHDDNYGENSGLCACSRWYVGHTRLSVWVKTLWICHGLSSLVHVGDDDSI